MNRKTLTGIVLTVALTLTGCEKVIDSAYKYDGAIGKDHVKYKSSIRFGHPFFQLRVNKLTIKKSDGITIEYLDDRNNDHQLDLVEVRNAIGEVIYQGYQGKDEKVLKIVQEQFDNYLRLIKEAKNKKKKQD